MFILHVLDEKETEQIKARDTELAYYQQLLKEKVSIDPWTPNCALMKRSMCQMVG